MGISHGLAVHVVGEDRDSVVLGALAVALRCTPSSDDGDPGTGQGARLVDLRLAPARWFVPSSRTYRSVRPTARSERARRSSSARWSASR